METKHIKTYDGINLAYYENYNEHSKYGIVLIHGLAEHKGRYLYFFDKMYSMNISTFALDIRGHGESGGIRGHVDNFNTYLLDLSVFISFLKSKYPNLKIALFGHSLGGLIATGFVEQYGTVDFLVLSNPLLYSQNIKRLFHYIPYRLLGNVKIKKRHSESAEMLKYSYNDPLSCNYFTLHLLGSIFDQGIPTVSQNLDKVKLPVLLLGGELDPLVKTNKFNKLLSFFGSKEKKLIMYSNIKHRLLQSEKKDIVINDITNWINSHIKK